MVKAIRFHKVGGPEVLSWDDIDLPPLGEEDIRVRHTVIGLNFIDTYHRWPLSTPFPQVLMEGAGVVTDVGRGVTSISVGDRVAYASPPPGSYAEERNINADAVVKIPDSVSDKVAAALMLKGLTAQYLIRQIHKVGPSDTILIHAAAGGV